MIDEIPIIGVTGWTVNGFGSIGGLEPHARGGLEPAFRVLFSAVFQGVSLGISIRVETCGK